MSIVTGCGGGNYGLPTRGGHGANFSVRIGAFSLKIDLKVAVFPIELDFCELSFGC